MNTSIVLFPGTNREQDLARAVKLASGYDATMVWHKDSDLPPSDLVIIPGGFSFGDYLRSGAIAARSPIMRAVMEAGKRGVSILGICNGFQILTECGMLPGSLMRNAHLKFVCKMVTLKVQSSGTMFTSAYPPDSLLQCPVAHHDGNYRIDDEGLLQLQDNGQIIFRYAQNSNPNGSVDDIAGISNIEGNVLGMMPHPENYLEADHGGDDGKGIFTSIYASLLGGNS